MLPARRLVTLCASLFLLASLGESVANAAPVPPGDRGQQQLTSTTRGRDRAPGMRAGLTSQEGAGKTASPGPVSGVRFSASSFYYDDISRAPLDANSAAIVSKLEDQVKNHWNGVAAFNAYQYNVPLYTVTSATPRINVGWFNCQKQARISSGLLNGAGHFLNVPVPDNAVPAKGTDSSIAIYDRTSDTLWEFWRMQRNATTGAWEACWGGRIDKVGSSSGVFPKTFGAAASGLSLAGGMISLSEARAGRIDHAMYLAVIEARHYSQFSWPANRSDGFTRSPDTLMEGQRLRLDPSLNLDDYALTPLGRVIAKAAQKYGFVVSDKGGAVALIGESGQPEQARTGVDPWPALMGSRTYEVMRNFPWDKMQVLPPDYGRP